LAQILVEERISLALKFGRKVNGIFFWFAIIRRELAEKNKKKASFV